MTLAEIAVQTRLKAMGLSHDSYTLTDMLSRPKTKFVGPMTTKQFDAVRPRLTDGPAITEQVLHGGQAYRLDRPIDPTNTSSRNAASVRTMAVLDATVIARVGPNKPCDILKPSYAQATAVTMAARAERQAKREASRTDKLAMLIGKVTDKLTQLNRDRIKAIEQGQTVTDIDVADIVAHVAIEQGKIAPWKVNTPHSKTTNPDGSIVIVEDVAVDHVRQRSNTLLDVIASLAVRFPRGFSSAINKRTCTLPITDAMHLELKRAKRNLALAEAYTSEVFRPRCTIRGASKLNTQFSGGGKGSFIAKGCVETGADATITRILADHAIAPVVQPFIRITKATRANYAVAREQVHTGGIEATGPRYELRRNLAGDIKPLPVASSVAPGMYAAPAMVIEQYGITRLDKVTGEVYRSGGRRATDDYGTWYPIEVPGHVEIDSLPTLNRMFPW